MWNEQKKSSSFLQKSKLSYGNFNFLFVKKKRLPFASILSSLKEDIILPLPSPVTPDR